MNWISVDVDMFWEIICQDTLGFTLMSECVVPQYYAKVLPYNQEETHIFICQITMNALELVWWVIQEIQRRKIFQLNHCIWRHLNYFFPYWKMAVRSLQPWDHVLHNANTWLFIFRIPLSIIMDVLPSGFNPHLWNWWVLRRFNTV